MRILRGRGYVRYREGIEKSLPPCILNIKSITSMSSGKMGCVHGESIIVGIYHTTDVRPLCFLFSLYSSHILTMQPFPSFPPESYSSH